MGVNRRSSGVAAPSARAAAGALPDLAGTSVLPALDGVRAVAALAVVLTHVGFQTGLTPQGQLGAVLARLDFGVTLFFLLSGFLLYRPFAAAHLDGRAGPRWRDFWRNRALRVLPAYLVLVVLAVSLLSRDRGAGELLRQALLLQTLEPDHLLPGMTHTWSLVVEVGFYAVLPLLALAARPRQPRTPDQQLRVELALLGGLALLALTSQAGGGLGPDGVANLWLPSFLDWFALGMLLAVLRAWRARTGRGRALGELAGATGTLLAVGLLLLWLATTPLAGPRGLEPPTAWEAVVKHALYGLAAAALLAPVVLGDEGSAWSRLLSSRPARWLGRISYGVFLFHLLVLDLVYRLPGLEPFQGRALLVLALVVPVSLAAAQLSLVVVEQPALRRKRRGVPVQTGLAGRTPPPR